MQVLSCLLTGIGPMRTQRRYESDRVATKTGMIRLVFIW
jgi:hypothetical protein